MHKLKIDQIWNKDALLLDVRSEGEYTHAHIPEAVSLPIFNDEERAIVGTLYKQVSREKAVEKGLSLFKEKMESLLQQAYHLLKTSSKNEFIIYCWRGGLRSATIAWLLSLNGAKVSVIEGGYKSFRRWALDQFIKDYSFKIVGGFTGSAKTETLHELAKLGEQIIDLEGLANHKGSAFGHIDMPHQVKQEHFENLLAIALYQLPYKNQAIFIEDESQRIGYNMIPNDLWKTMRSKEIYYLDIPFEARLGHIVEEYGALPIDELIIATQKITKNLGGLETKTALAFLEEKDFENAFRILLKYYDKFYQKGLQKRENWESLKINIEASLPHPKSLAQNIKQTHEYKTHSV
jgi:tRNA 2-selenouridine synthase